MAVTQSIRIKSKKSLESIRKVLSESEYHFVIKDRGNGIWIKWRNGLNTLRGTIVDEGDVRSGALELSCFTHAKFLEIKQSIKEGFKAIGVDIIE